MTHEEARELLSKVEKRLNESKGNFDFDDLRTMLFLTIRALQQILTPQNATCDVISTIQQIPQAPHSREFGRYEGGSWYPNTGGVTYPRREESSYPDRGGVTYPRR